MPAEPTVPLPRTPLVGRASDVEAVVAWLDAGERLVTITGPVGIGKTRVAVEVARTADVTARVALADLAGARDEASVSDAIARACGLGDDGRASPLQNLARALRGLGDVLVVLDSADELARFAGTWLEPLLASAPAALFVVVSRERTHVPGEIVHEVRALPEGVELFIACGQRLRAGFAPSDADRDTIRAIVKEVEGVPLLIELAAARLPIMAPRAILHRLRAGGPELRTALERVLGTAWTALEPDLASGLAALSVLRGAFSLSAAEAVVAHAVKVVPIEVVSALRDKSLLLSDEDGHGEVLLRLPRAVRAFAHEKLDAEARANAETAHAEYFGGVARALLRDGSKSIVVRDKEARARLVADEDNLLLVVERMLQRGSVSAAVAEPALRAMLALAPLLSFHRPSRAYEVLVDPAIAKTRDSGADPHLLGDVLLVRGALRRRRGDSKAAARDLVQALTIAKTVNNARLAAGATLELGLVFEDTGETTEALAHLGRAATLFAELGDALSEGRTHTGLARVLAKSDVAKAREHLERARALHMNDPSWLAQDALVRGAVELAAGELGRAREASEESLALATAADDVRGAAEARLQLGLIAQRRGDRSTARTCFEAAHGAVAEAGLARLAAIAERHLGLLAKEEGRSLEADARLRASHRALVELSENALAVEVSRDMESSAASSSPASSKGLVIGAEGRWFVLAGAERVDLSRRRVLTLMLERLAEERSLRPGVALSSRALQEAAWPGEKIAHAAAAHRVRVAISTLRKHGLPVVTTADGWALDPAVDLVRAP